MTVIEEAAAAAAVAMEEKIALSQINTEIRIMASVECHVPGFYVVVSMSASSPSSSDTFLNDKRSVHIPICPTGGGFAQHKRANTSMTDSGS